MKRSAFRQLYEALLDRYGPQGWWPLVSCAGAPGFDPRGYHPRDYMQPSSPNGRFEVAVGAVLAQNTSWRNVERAISSLHHAGLLAPRPLASLALRSLAALIRPSGYYNQKARKLRELAAFFTARTIRTPPAREALLGLWGIGPETADSILLYAFHRPVFVVDAYTRRLLERLGWIAGNYPYAAVQELFHEALAAQAPLFEEYHALIVRHAKEHCRKAPRCAGCPLAGSLCRYAALTA